MDNILIKLAENSPMAFVLGVFLWQTLKRFDRLTESINGRLDKMTLLLGEMVGKDRRKLPDLDA